MTMKQIMTGLSEAVRRAVLPGLGTRAAKEILGKGASGDFSYGIDQVAETAVKTFMDENAPDVAYFTEDVGLVAPAGAKTLFIIDPIDGTRSAACGFESCCVSVAAAPFRPEGLCLSDVTHGLILEIKGDGSFWAEKGRGVEIVMNGQRVPILLSENIDFEKLRWEMGFTGRPASYAVSVMSTLIDGSTVQGGYFTLNSVCYAGTRVLTGQLDAVIDLGKRIYQSIPESREVFRRAGKGTLMGQFPYDLAALNLILKEGGAVMTDAFGEPLDDMKLLDCNYRNLRSCVIAASDELHRGLMVFINYKFREFGSTIAEYMQLQV